jgi:hypothetical protein
MKIKEHRHREHHVRYVLAFNYLEPPESRGAGFMFDCDESGKVDVDKLPDAAKESYRDCLAGASGGQPLSKGRVEKFEHYYTNPAVGECEDCGQDVVLHGFTNTCECGVDYNMSGQRLADRSQWGEETGESVSDILMADADYDAGRDFNDY